MTTDRVNGGHTRFASVVLDVDSTLSSTEGIEWLAARRGAEVSRRVTEATQEAMHGEIALQDVYAKRLDLIRPTHRDIEMLGREYIETVLPGARDALSAIRGAGVRIVIVSGGLREAIIPLTRSLNVPDSDLHAVSLSFTEAGDYAGFDIRSPLTRNGGKPAVVRSLHLPRPILAIGDGITDAELKTDLPAAADAFAAFTGVAARDPIIRVSDYVLRCFDQLPTVVLS